MAPPWSRLGKRCHFEGWSRFSLIIVFIRFFLRYHACQCLQNFLSIPFGVPAQRNQGWDNWNRNQNRPCFKLDGIGIESTTNFLSEIGIEIGINTTPHGIGIGIKDIILCQNRNCNWNLTIFSGIMVPESSHHWKEQLFSILYLFVLHVFIAKQELLVVYNYRPCFQND